VNLESLDFGGSDYLGMVVGGLAYFALGALWYTLLFQKPWMAATGRSEQEFEAMQGASPVWMLATLAGAIVATAVIAIAYRWGGGDGVVDGIVVGAILGIGVAAMENLKNVIYNFDDRSHPWTLYGINTAYAVLGFIIAGAVYSLIA
jgi:RsiW-degrading membrane proteinase PrsW (M82 family)